MCSIPDKTPTELDQANAATISLPGSSPDSPEIAAKDSGDTKNDSAIKTEDAQDDLVPQIPETDTAAMTSAVGSLATIPEQTDSFSPDGECVMESATNSDSTPENTIEHETSGRQVPTEPSDVLPPPEAESVADEVGDNESASLSLQSGGITVRSLPSETVMATNPTIVVSGDGGGELDHGTSEALAKVPTDIAANDSAESEDHKFVDPNDKENIGSDVIKFFYTASTRKRHSSPVTAAPGCCNPRMHRDSDLYIKAKGEDGKLYVFEVASATLEKASPKFEAMIYGSHTRGNKEEWVWELDDNPLGLKIMFCLLHNKFPRALVASKPNPDQLYRLLLVLEKYEIDLQDTNYHLFAPSWIDGFNNGLATSKLSALKALRVAYAIGDFKTTKILIRETAHEVSDEDGKCLQDLPMQQQEILDSIENIRAESLKRLLDSLRVPLEYFMDAQNLHGNQYCKSSEGHFECNQKLLGSLMANLVQQSLFPIPDPASYKGSVAAMIEKIEKMEIRGLFYPGVVMTEQKHTLCKLGQAVAVEEVRGKDGKGFLPLSDNLVEYMYFACKRNGRLRKEQKEFEPYKVRVQEFDLLYRDEFKKDVWGWDSIETAAGHTACDGSDDSGTFDVVDNSLCTGRKVSA